MEAKPKSELGPWYTRVALRKGRLALNKTQREIADEVSLSTDTVRDYEAGRSSPPAKNIKALAKACGINEEVAEYMVGVALARKKAVPVEAEMRFNARLLAMAEEFYGSIFKFDMTLIPGPLQLQEYHYKVVRMVEPVTTDEWIDGGWEFKEARGRVIWYRTDRPVLHFLIGELALIHLRQFSAELYERQMAHLRRWSRRKGVAIRILRGSLPARLSTFSIYRQGESPLAGPPFVYTEIADSSWLIDDPTRIAGYDDIRKNLWKKAIRIEVYNDDDWRNHLAQEHS